MANVGSKGIVRYEETFATPTVGASGAGIAWVVSNDSGADFARAVNTSRGLHITGVTGATAGNMTELCGDTLMFTGQTGHSSVELLVQFDVVTNLAFNFGFNDEVLETGGSASLPMELTTTAWASNSANFLGFAFDTAADNDDLHCCWVASNVDCATTSATLVEGKSLRMSGIAPTADKWLYLKVEMQDRGSGNGVRATFMAADHAGRSAEKVFNTTVARTTPMCFYFGLEARTTSARNCRIKCPAWEQTIETV